MATADAMERNAQSKPPTTSSSSSSRNCKCGKNSNGSCKPCSSSSSSGSRTGSADTQERRATTSAPTTGVTRATPPAATGSSSTSRTGTADSMGRSRSSSSGSRNSRSASWGPARERITMTGAGSAGASQLPKTEYEKKYGGKIIMPDGRILNDNIDLSGVDWQALGRLMVANGVNPADIPGYNPGSGDGQKTPSTQTPTTQAPGTQAPGTQNPNDIWGNLMNDFNTILGQERGMIDTAGSQLQQALQTVDPMAAFQWNTNNVPIPQSTLSNYVNAIGGSNAEVDATRALGQSLLNSYLGDVGQFAQGTQSADTTYRQRQQMVGMQNQANALRQLALNSMAAKYGIQSAKAAEQRGLQNDILQLMLQYMTMKPNGSGLTGSIPGTRYNQMTLPGGRVINVDTSWMG